MNSFININKKDTIRDHEVFTGDNFEKFIRDLPSMAEEELARIKHSTVNILSNCVAPTFTENSNDQNTGLVLGYVQSGKTMSFTSLIALASDNNYKIVIVLAGTTTILLKQTIERLSDDLSDRNNYVLFAEGNLDNANRMVDIMQNSERERIIILPILKHYKHIEKLEELFAIPKLKRLLPTKGVLIIDDEADQASLNGLARKNYKLSKKTGFNELDENENEIFKYSTTYNRISRLKEVIPNHSYIQYTATPQANILLSQRDLLRPSWCEVLDPGNKYTGGLRFFNENTDLLHVIDKENVKETVDPEMPENLKHAFRLFLIESALLCYNYANSNRSREKLKLTSMMIHADRLIDVNSHYIKWLKSFKDNIKQDLFKEEEEEIEELTKIFKHVKANLVTYFDQFPDFNEVIKKIRFWVLDDLEFWFVAGNVDNEVDWKSGVHHVLVGGQKLDRGFTVKNLVVTYMPRTTKGRSNADTIEQRCRFFGYKKDYIEACRVYLPSESITEFNEYVSFEIHLRNYLKSNPIDEFYNNDRLIKLCGLNPTSLNKIPGELLSNDFRGFRYFEPNFSDKDFNNKVINEFNETCKFQGELSYAENDSFDNRHKIFSSNIKAVKRLFKVLKTDTNKEKIKKHQFITILNEYKDNDEVGVIEMAYGRLDGRPRSLHPDGTIKSLASNYPPAFGDRVLLREKSASGNFIGRYENKLVVQIHNIKIVKSDQYPKSLKEHENKMLKILATNFPNSLSNSFISVNYD